MNISNELLAAYAEGNVTQEERNLVRQYLMEHPEALDTVLIAMDDDYDLSLEKELENCQTKTYDDNLMSLLKDVREGKQDCNLKILPITAMAAQNIIDNLCVVCCEGYALRHFGVDVSDKELSEKSIACGWQKPEGTALYNIGRLCSVYGLNVATLYNCSIIDIKQSLNRNDVVIATLNRQNLLGKQESLDFSPIKLPNHSVIVTAVGQDNVTLQDTATPSLTDTYPIAHFVNAWECSSYNLVVISNNDEHYEPHPVDLADVQLTDELIELREAIAENAHEVWAYNRKKEGWTYGPVRDDEKKTNPDLVPYNKLPESEKLYDREMAMNTIKLLNKLGWEVKKK